MHGDANGAKAGGKAPEVCELGLSPIKAVKLDGPFFAQFKS